MTPDVLVVAGFELRPQLRSHVFLVVLVISALMVFGSVTVDELRVGLGDETLRNGASAIVQTHLVWTLFCTFTAAAFVADAVLRDDLTGFAPIIQSAPVGRASYFVGRFVGAFAALILCFMSVPAAMLLATFAPWLDSATVGPLLPSAYVFAVFVLAMPNLFLISAASFGLATAMRSMTAALLGAVALLVLYGLGSGAAGVELEPVLEPFGFAAYAEAVASWTPVERNGAVPPLAGALLHNRLLWLGIAAALLASSFLNPATRRTITILARPSEAIVDVTRSAPPAPCREPPPFTWTTTAAQFAARTRLEIGQILASPSFLVLLILGGVNAGAKLWTTSAPSGGSADARTIVIALYEAFRLLPTVIALFFAGKLMWNERQHGLSEIVGATPLPNAAFALPKLLALAGILLALAAAGGLAAGIVQLARGMPTIGLAPLLLSWIVPATFDWLLMAVLALFLQAVSPNKMAGWGWLVLFLILSLTMERLGLTDPLYRYGHHPGWPLPAAVSGAEGVDLHRAYWAAFALGLVVLTTVLAGRSAEEPPAANLRRLPTHLRGTAGLVLAASALGFVSFGLIIAGKR